MWVWHRHLRASQKKAAATRCLADGRVRDARAPARSIRSSSHRRRSIRRQPSTITVPTDAITVGRLRLAAAVAAPPGHRPPTTASSAGWAPPPDDRRHRRQCRRHHRDPEVFFFFFFTISRDRDTNGDGSRALPEHTTLYARSRYRRMFLTIAHIGI